MVFSNIICLYYQLLVFCVLTVGADMYDGILVHFGKNVSPGKIDDGGRVEIVLPSSRLHCFAMCARDPNCSQCARYDNDGTDEAAFKVLRGTHHHSDEYVLKCGYTDKPAPPTQNINKSQSPTQDTDKSASPTQDTDKSAPPTQNINKSTSPIQDTDKSASPTQDINKSPSPTQNINKSTSPIQDTDKSASPTQDINKSQSPTQYIDKSPPPTQDIDKSQSPTQDINKSPPPTQYIDKSPPPTQDIDKSPPPTQDINKSAPPTQDINKSAPPTQDINKSPPPTQDINKTAPPKHNVQKSPVLQDKASSTLQKKKHAGNVGPSRMTKIFRKTKIAKAANAFVRSTYKVVTVTGKTKDSSTDCLVYLRVYGYKNNVEVLYLHKDLRDMGAGKVDRFQFNRTKDIGNITKMELFIEKFGIAPAWFCVRIGLERRRQYTRHTDVEVYHSSLNRWFVENEGMAFLINEFTYKIPYKLQRRYRKRI